MAESYCSECNEGLYEPSIEDVMEGQQECPACGKLNICPKTESDVIIEMSEDIDKLKVIVQELKLSISRLIFEP